ncbi:50S ribosomal protein L18 [Polaribacter reichenbachii]|uniref:Large ribosomal subunit protein uL18 n=1 Tax=Polaribacter reichenbachii TaxID=996801 RepID=A0A1B8TWT9_9FLAO|nr:50S ribosomal protein L18 [Polaribacter reichenbachii]APZ45045.1 50S ribosomal protein L18 [Polaribacter reichenbachii]AUC18908.1 50S ribosomal protein L18 [Polaribacter reichenbachii]OBY63935.1 50S ribosomal protein L18 [Polaribacter reichenbachii]
MALSKLQRRARIKRRIRKIISGTATKPRLSVYRSNKEIYAQLIDDVNGVTLASVSSRDIKAATKAEAATAVGKTIAEKAVKAGVETVAFDRNGYLYHGRVKVLADAAREAGLKF